LILSKRLKKQCRRLISASRLCHQLKSDKGLAQSFIFAALAISAKLNEFDSSGFV
jgi:hypothetical protein